jgi:hypothetical protein
VAFLAQLAFDPDQCWVVALPVPYRKLAVPVNQHEPLFRDSTGQLALLAAGGNYIAAVRVYPLQ